MTYGRALVSGAVAGVVAIAATSVLFPGLLETIAPDVLLPPAEARSEAARTVLPVVAVLALVAAGYATWRLGRGGSTTPFVTVDLEAGSSDAVGTAGRRFSQQAAWAAHHWADRGYSAKSAEFEHRLRGAATEAYALAHDVDRDTARAAVDDGTWTDDAVAAWFLAEPDVDVSIPLSTWLAVRFQPHRAFDDCLERTANAIDDLRGEY